MLHHPIKDKQQLQPHLLLSKEDKLMKLLELLELHKLMEQHKLMQLHKLINKVLEMLMLVLVLKEETVLIKLLLLKEDKQVHLTQLQLPQLLQQHLDHQVNKEETALQHLIRHKLLNLEEINKTQIQLQLQPQL